MARINVYTTDEDGTRHLDGWFELNETEEFKEAKRWNGNNHVGVISGGQVGFQKLHRTKGGRWVLEFDFRNEFNGSHLWAYLPDAGAKEWLIESECNDDALEKYFGEVEEEKGPGRPEIGPAFSLRFPQELIDAVDEQAKSMKISRAQLIRMYTEAGLSAITIQQHDPGYHGADV